MSEYLKCDWCGKTTQHPYRGVPDEARADAMTAYYEFLHLRLEANEDADHGDLCSWNCLVNWAQQKERLARDANDRAAEAVSS